MNRPLNERRDHDFAIGRLAGTLVGDAVNELTRTGQGVRDDVAEAVASGARKVARYATAVDNALTAFGIYFPSSNTRSRLISYVKKQYETPNEGNHYAWSYISQLITLTPEFMLA